MPFIGTQPEVGGYSVLDALTASATASYTLQKDSANFVPSSANQLLVSLNGVIQKPGSSFTVSGSTLTFSSALTSSDSIDFIISMGEPLLIGTPSDSTVTGNKLASNIAITTSGNVSSSGNIVTTGSGTMTSAGLITASAGVAIGGTGSANTLDDYEEGSFTPTIQQEGGTSLNVGYNTGSGYTKGRYTKIGNIVTFQCTISLTSVSGGSSGHNLNLNNLPFTSADYQTRSNGGAKVTYTGNTGTALLFGIVLGSSTNLRFYVNGGTAVTTDAIQSNTHIQLYGQYEVA